MTTEEIRIKVAESFGWRKTPFGDLIENHPRTWRTLSDLPNYPESLDAIVPVIRDLPTEEQWAIFETLLEVVPAEHPAACATAKEWCLAYLKTKGIIQ